jgi:hypothetical protein
MKPTRFILTLVFALCLASLAHACPLCRDTAATVKNDLDQTGAASLGGGFNHSIYFMFTGLLAALGIVAFNLTKGIRGK